mmetsp:Transcript_13418/g.37953  ORF Transcript_13418/g.37953 Transcript_13418/m.37953 type:complete len:599 (+) Transcript_13418:254-2050(+)
MTRTCSPCKRSAASSSGSSRRSRPRRTRSCSSATPRWLRSALSRATGPWAPAGSTSARFWSCSRCARSSAWRWTSPRDRRVRSSPTRRPGCRTSSSATTTPRATRGSSRARPWTPPIASRPTARSCACKRWAMASLAPSSATRTTRCAQSSRSSTHKSRRSATRSQTRLWTSISTRTRRRATLASTRRPSARSPGRCSCGPATTTSGSTSRWAARTSSQVTCAPGLPRPTSRPGPPGKPSRSSPVSTPLSGPRAERICPRPTAAGSTPRARSSWWLRTARSSRKCSRPSRPSPTRSSTPSATCSARARKARRCWTKCASGSSRSIPSASRLSPLPASPCPVRQSKPSSVPLTTSARRCSRRPSRTATLWSRSAPTLCSGTVRTSRPSGSSRPLAASRPAWATGWSTWAAPSCRSASAVRWLPPTPARAASRWFLTPSSSAALVFMAHAATTAASFFRGRSSSTFPRRYFSPLAALTSPPPRPPQRPSQARGRVAPERRAPATLGAATRTTKRNPPYPRQLSAQSVSRRPRTGIAFEARTTPCPRFRSPRRASLLSRLWLPTRPRPSISTSHLPPLPSRRPSTFHRPPRSRSLQRRLPP